MQDPDWWKVVILKLDDGTWDMDHHEVNLGGIKQWSEKKSKHVFFPAFMYVYIKVNLVNKILVIVVATKIEMLWILDLDLEVKDS